MQRESIPDCLVLKRKSDGCRFKATNSNKRNTDAIIQKMMKHFCNTVLLMTGFVEWFI